MKKIVQVIVAAGIIIEVEGCHAGRSTGMNDSTPIDSSRIKNSVSAIAPYDSEHVTNTSHNANDTMKNRNVPKGDTAH